MMISSVVKRYQEGFTMFLFITLANVLTPYEFPVNDKPEFVKPMFIITLPMDQSIDFPQIEKPKFESLMLQRSLVVQLP